jgi:glycine hydroxymethyltransferase
MIGKHVSFLSRRLMGSASQAAFSDRVYKRSLFLPDDKPLAQFDPEMASIIAAEKQRQFAGIELIASENYATRYTLEL